MTNKEPTLLSTAGLAKHFGGVKAVDNISLSVTDKSVHGIIGPNGAGKTTLISLLSGGLRPDDGSIFFLDRDITKESTDRRAKQGLARSFQITSIILPMTILENVMLSAQGRRKHAYQFWHPANENMGIKEQAISVIEQVGLLDKMEKLASEISHGEQRQLELAMALAMQPKLLLLDEPMAGMGHSESEKITKLLNVISQDKAILLIEHDMDAVFQLANTISVLVNGSIIASDKPSNIRTNPQVQTAYLGGPSS
ncbi:MAG: ATP-binding cassette domain-containing protein [Gammaproteobacteria bacterium]|nr:ATP-binding cassette domain-containing protein [Gammaproteobacteria bacterium]